MKNESRTIQKGFFAAAALVLMFALFLSMSVGSSAASKAAKNNTAHSKLTAKLKSTLPSYSYIRYKFADVTADGIDELIMVCAPSKKGAGKGEYLIYTYAKNKKVKKIFGITSSGIVHFRFHKKTKSIITYTLGNNKEGFYIYQLQKNGKYKLLGSKSREARKAGAIEDGLWKFKKGTKKTSKTKFNKIVKKVKKGTPKVYNVREFEVMIKEKSEDSSNENPDQSSDQNSNQSSDQNSNQGSDQNTDQGSDQSSN